MRIDSWPWFDVTAAYIALMAGVLLIYWECARPGSYLPGAAGAALVLIAIARFASMPWTAAGAALALAACAAWLAELWFRWPGVPGLAGALLMTWACTRAVESQPVRWWVALPLAALVGFATVVLGSAALRGFIAKRTA
ncbi:MAG: hypothetical protein U0Q16_01280 [Bryobacteraceae bacterium]